jgi:hypothetical protein
MRATISVTGRRYTTHTGKVIRKDEEVCVVGRRNVISHKNGMQTTSVLSTTMSLDHPQSEGASDSESHEGAPVAFKNTACAGRMSLGTSASACARWARFVSTTVVKLESEDGHIVSVQDLAE